MRPEFREIRKWLFLFILGSILGVAMTHLNGLQGYCTFIPIRCDSSWFTEIVIVLFGIILLVFVWGIEKLLIPISGKTVTVKNVEDSPFHCHIEITNRYDKDFSDLQVELKRLTMIGYRVDCLLGSGKPFFLLGKRNEGNRIRKGETATIYLVEVPADNTDKFFVDFLINPAWRCNYIYRDISGESEERKKSLGELAGVIYEFVIEISGKVGDDYIDSQVYRGRIIYLSVNHKDLGWKPKIQWIRFDKHSMKKENTRYSFRPDDEVIRNREDFWRMVRKMERN